MFKPAFLGRVVVIPYLPLSDDVLLGVVRLQLGRLAQQVRDMHGAALHVADGVEATVVGRARNAAIGARAVEQTILREILPSLSRLFLRGLADGVGVMDAVIEAAPDGSLHAKAGAPQPAALAAAAAD